MGDRGDAVAVPGPPDDCFAPVCPLVTGFGAALELDETETTGNADAVGKTADGVSADDGGAIASPGTALALAKVEAPKPAPHLGAITPTNPALTTATKTAAPNRARGTRDETLGGDVSHDCVALASALGMVTD